MTESVRKTEKEWRELLTEEQFHVTREKGTERPFTGPLNDCKADGVYRCVCCGNTLFGSDAKFDSGSGWPSFHSPIAADAVQTEQDDSLMMRRTEVLCATCEAHLGHVFPDGPAPTGSRFCINSAALTMDETAEPANKDRNP